MKYLKTYNESLRDKMQPKSDEEILKELNNLNPEKILYLSIENNYLSGVKKAIEMGVDINLKIEGQVPLINAIRKKNIEIVKLLLENGADVNISNKDKNTPLLIACFRNSLELVKILLEYGANVNDQNQHGETPLIMLGVSIKTNDGVEILKLLLDHGANPNIKSYSDYSVFDFLDDSNLEELKIINLIKNEIS